MQSKLHGVLLHDVVGYRLGGPLAVGWVEEQGFLALPGELLANIEPSLQAFGGFVIEID
jgi:hypothetical protein